jgi:hypothetical protein
LLFAIFSYSSSYFFMNLFISFHLKLCFVILVHRTFHHVKSIYGFCLLVVRHILWTAVVHSHLIQLGTRLLVQKCLEIALHGCSSIPRGVCCTCLSLLPSVLCTKGLSHCNHKSLFYGGSWVHLTVNLHETIIMLQKNLIYLKKKQKT